MFDSPAAYRRVKEADILTNTVICKIYRVTRNEIITNMYFDPAQAWKCTIKRLWAQGSVGERDTLGTQQHAPLLDIDVPAASNAASVPGVGSIAGPAPDRRGFTALDIVREIWGEVGLPEASLSSLSLPGSDTQDAPALPSSYKIGAIAQSTIALSALAAAQVYAILNQCPTPPVRVPLQHSVVEFKSERLYRIDGKPPPSPWGPIGGLHKTADGYVRIHDSFPNHCFGALELLGLPSTASRSEVSEKTSQWASIDLESTGVLEQKLALYALRSYQQWDMLPQSGAIDNIPISLRKVAPGPVGLPSSLTPGKDRCLRGLRVVEMSRVIAAPLAGKTLAAHGADVLWVTSPFLPDLPSLDREFSRGKRTVQLAVSREEDLEQLKELLRTADVFIQGFRPGSLAKYGLSAKEIAATNPGIICANMSAFGPKGPWSGRRGFDSLVQTCSGMNVSEAEHFGAGEAARPTPCQALDHGAGYLLAAGISSALCRRASEGGSWQVDVSLAGVMKYLRSLGQFPGQTGFNCRDYERAEDVEGYLETRESEFGQMEYVKHSVQIDGCEPGWDIMPRSLGSDEPEWLEEQREE